MVDFSVGFDTQKEDDVCKEMVEQIPGTILEMVEGTRGGEEQAIGASVVKGNWYATDVRGGTETEISGQIIQDLWLDAQMLSEEPHNARTSDTYIMHTHPSGLAGMSFNDVASAIEGAKKASPITGNFVITEHRGRVKINGVTLKDKYKVTRQKRMEMGDIDTLMATKMRITQAVDEGIISHNKGKSELMEDMVGILDTCSYIVSIADLENRARQNG